MRNRKWGTLLALLMVLAMCVWTLSACGDNGGSGEAEEAAEPEATVEGYTNAEVTSDLSIADAVKAYYDAVDMDYAYDLVSLSWIKQILYWISVYRRFNTFYVGVFSVADFVFYICAAAVFLFLTVRVLEKKRWS